MPHTRHFQEVNILLKYLLTQNSIFLIITQIALQLTSALSYGGSDRVGRNENVTGVKVILRISVAKLVFGFCRITWIWATAWKFESFCPLSFEGREGVNCIKKERKKTDRQYEVKRLWSAYNPWSVDQYQFTNEPPLRVFSVLGIWVKKIHEI